MVVGGCDTRNLMQEDSPSIATIYRVYTASHLGILVDSIGNRRTFLSCRLGVVCMHFVCACMCMYLFFLSGDTGMLIVSEEKSFMVIASSAVDKDGWLQAIRLCMRDLSIKNEAREKICAGQVTGEWARIRIWMPAVELNVSLLLCKTRQCGHGQFDMVIDGPLTNDIALRSLTYSGLFLSPPWFPPPPPLGFMPKRCSAVSNSSSKTLRIICIAALGFCMAVESNFHPRSHRCMERFYHYTILSLRAYTLKNELVS